MPPLLLKRRKLALRRLRTRTTPLPPWAVEDAKRVRLFRRHDTLAVEYWLSLTVEWGRATGSGMMDRFRNMHFQGVYAGQTKVESSCTYRLKPRDRIHLRWLTATLTLWLASTGRM